MLRIAIAALSLFAIAPNAAFAQHDQSAQPQHPTGTQSDQQGSMKMHDQMQRGSQQMQGMQMSGDADRDFMTMMRQHHQQAIEMAQTEIKEGKDATAKAFARKVIQEQEKEIKQLDQWLAKKQRADASK